MVPHTGRHARLSAFSLLYTSVGRGVLTVCYENGVSKWAALVLGSCWRYMDILIYSGIALRLGYGYNKLKYFP